MKSMKKKEDMTEMVRMEKLHLELIDILQKNSINVIKFYFIIPG